MGGVTSRLFDLNKSALVAAGQEEAAPVGLAVITLSISAPSMHNPSHWMGWYVENQLLALGGCRRGGCTVFYSLGFLVHNYGDV